MEQKSEKTQPKFRTVYYLDVEELQSRTYAVVANSIAEAKRILNHEQYVQETHVQWEFDLDRGYNLCEVDGAIQWIKSYAPKFSHRETQVKNDDGEFEAVEE